MKKLPILFSLLVVFALALAACGGNNNAAENNGLNNGTGVNNGTVDDGTLDTEEPLLDVTPTEAVVEPGLDMTETPLPDEPVLDMTETPVTQTDDTTDDTAGVPVTGDAGDYCYPNRLSHMIGSDLIDQNGVLIGEVQGALISGINMSVVSEDSLGDVAFTDDADVVGDDAAGDDADVVGDDNVGDDVTGDDTADDGVLDDDNNAAQTGPMAMQGSAGNAKVSYLLVDIADDTDLFDNDRDILIPLGALQVEMARQPLDVQENCVFTMSQDITVLQNAPYFEDEAWTDQLDLSMPDWDAEYNTYWTDQGVTFDNTTAADVNNDAQVSNANVANAVLLEGDFAINVRNYNDEDLGEVSEFIFDTTSGAIQYGILAEGGFLGLGEDYFPVPMDRLSWVAFQDDLGDVFDINYKGEFLMNVSEDAFDDVDGIGDLDSIDFTDTNWSANYDTIWNERVPLEQ